MSLPRSYENILKKLSNILQIQLDKKGITSGEHVALIYLLNHGKYQPSESVAIFLLKYLLNGTYQNFSFAGTKVVWFMQSVKSRHSNCCVFDILRLNC